MFPKPSDRKFGARGDGRDDGEAIQRFLDGIAGKSGQIDRDYLSGRSLQVHPSTTLYGPGGIGAHPSFSPSEILVSVPSGCRFFDVGFRGDERTREAQPGALMIYVSNANDVVFHGCEFSWWRTLVGMAATKRVQFSGCEFSQWGDTVELPALNTPEGETALREGKPFHGSCLFDGGYALLGGNGSWPNDNVDVIGCSFHDGNWTAIECLQPLGIKWRIMDTQILRVKECGIYCGATATIDNVTIHDIRLRDCSAHGIEGGGLGTVITRSRIGMTDGACVFVANPVGMRVVGNTFYDPMQMAPVDSDPTVWSAAIFVRNIPAVPEHLANGLVIADNEMICRDGRATHCCSFFDVGGGPFHNATVGPNVASGTWKGVSTHCDPAARGVNFRVIEHAHA